MRHTLLVLLTLAILSISVHADPNSDLLNAARDGDLARVRQALSSGASVNALDAYGRSAVLIAIVESHPTVLKYLLERDGNPNTRMRTTHREAFPISKIGRRSPDRSSVVTRLLDAGANRNIAAKYPLIVEKPRNPDESTVVAGRHMTPLMIASLRGDAESAALLIAAGADVDATSLEGFTALMFAVLSYPFPARSERAGATAADLVEPGSVLANVLSASVSPTQRAR